MEDIYINDSLSQNISGFGNINEAGVRYTHTMSSNNAYPMTSNAIINPDIEKMNRKDNINIQNTPIDNADIRPDTEAREADISVFRDMETNVPDFFVYNISENMFVIFLATAALLASARINNKLISFILFVVISLLVSTEYGVSFAIVFYAIFFVDDMDIFVIILVVLALLHIFLPIPGLVTSTFNWNYIIGTVLGLLLLLSINNNWKRVFCVDNSLKYNKLYKEDNIGVSNITY
ncbi:unknown similar to AMEV157 [Adoxophyes honmai entomopoxvirus 'L']|uniref:Uncharacterized protein n=1 Tax=Adoxophyes honmai entomopoxvirus 'L' TaxID=1293540 RepID=A0A916NWY4_9POXV|nr:unknown similar to AMEV157 [Adoxophyes honmai entomopoxvirus 'L']CCU55497.1 unknown similar to AMEV157 [Adoxophyes honmai entomopoxvirus 'L']